MERKGHAVNGRDIGQSVAVSLATGLLCVSLAAPAGAQDRGKGYGAFTTQSGAANAGAAVGTMQQEDCGRRCGNAPEVCSDGGGVGTKLTPCTFSLDPCTGTCTLPKGHPGVGGACVCSHGHRILWYKDGWRPNQGFGR